MIKKILIGLGLMILLAVSFFFYSNNKKNNSQDIYEETLDVSKEYLRLRYQTDLILTEAKKYSFEDWNKKVDEITKGWENLEKKANKLQNEAEILNNEKTSFKFNSEILAYDKQEISNIFDKAPAGKKIATLAKHLGVDAKMAFKILQQDQNQVTADAWNEAGNTFQKLETSAKVIKDTCKVAGFVGGIVMTGGTSAIASGSLLSKAVVIVSGSDLVLEVTDDAATIALGNNNKVSAIVGGARTVTEPLANILSISDIPKNLKTGYEKFNVVMTALDQFNSTVQEGKVIGINLPVYKKEKTDKKIEVSIMESNEIDKWMEDNKIENKSETIKDIEEILEINKKIELEEEKPKEEKNTKEEKMVEKQNGSNPAVGTWSGILQHVVGGSKRIQKTNLLLSLKEDGTFILDKNIEEEEDNEDTKIETVNWKQEGNSIHLFFGGEMSSFSYVFNLSGDSLIFTKIVIGDNEVLAGEDFIMGSTVYTGTLTRQK